MLGQAERPLIYAGGGVIHGNAATALRRLAIELELPVVTTLMGIGAIDTSHPLSMRMLGMHGAAFANYAVDDCDFLIAVGARFDDRVAGAPDRFARNAKWIAHLDVDASEIGKVKRVQWSHVGVLSAALEALRTYAGRSGFRRDRTAWHGHLDELRRTHAMNYDRESPLIQPYYVIEELNRRTRGEAIITTGVGQHQMWAAQYFDFREPRLWLTSGSMGTMGFGLPAAIGAQFARRDRLVIDVDGDASMRMNMGELETVTTYDLPIKVLVMNNHGDGMVRQWQKLFFKGRMSASDKSLHKKDFVAAAQRGRLPVRRAAGAQGRRAARGRGIHRFPGSRVPRSDHRSRRRRLSDGRPRPGLRGDDHRGSHRIAHEGGATRAGRVGDVLTPRRRAMWLTADSTAPAPRETMRDPRHEPRGSPTFADAARFWIKLGLISFGGPAGQIAIMHRELVERRGWVDEAQFTGALNFCMLLPGPEAMQLAIYIGWKLHGVRGGLVAGLTFVLPAIVLLLVLSWVYAAHGQLPAVAGVLSGLKAAVVALVLQALLKIGRRALAGPLHVVLAVAQLRRPRVPARAVPADRAGRGCDRPGHRRANDASGAARRGGGSRGRAAQGAVRGAAACG